MELIERLRRAREKAGLSLEELATRTKIQQRILEAIEAGDFKRVPGGLFVRGFLRSYAREVGLDPEEVVAQYLAEFEPALLTPEVPDEPDEPAAQADISLPETPTPAWRKLWPAAFVLGALIAVFTFFSSTPQTAPAAEPAPVGTSGQAAPQPTASAPAPAARPELLTMDIRAKREVWVAVMADGQKAVYRTLQPDERVNVMARQQIAARIGDAEAFEYSINGVPGKPLGAASEVKDVVITPDNYLEFRRQ
jgi:cytoskeleton protein RodZ